MVRTVQTLIDECVDLCGSQSALARRLGVEPGDVSKLQGGKRPISPETVALLCDVLQLGGEESRRLTALAIVERAKPDKKEALRRALFVCWALSVGALLSSQTDPAQASPDTTDAAGLPTVCILC